MGDGHVVYRRAARGDLTGIGEVFLAAFPESVEHYVGQLRSPRAVADLFAVCLDAEPGGLLVATVGGRVVGYIFAPARFSRLTTVALLRGHALRMGWRWLTGRYGVGLRAALAVARNWALLRRAAGASVAPAEARILSIAVHPGYRRRGIGRHLLDLGLDYLATRGAAAVRLEVRPGNEGAVHIYAKSGFRIIGSTNDSQGEWLIMVKEMAGPPQA